MPIRALCLALLLATGGCQATDPYQRVGLWRPNGSNDANLRQMIAAPSDLLAGRGNGVDDGQQAVAALDRLRADKVKPLPASGIAQITVQSPPAATGGQ